MKLKIALSLLLSSVLLGEENIAKSSQIKPLKEFSPPPLITPMNALSQNVENQFSNPYRLGFYSSLNTLDNSINPFHFASGIYGNSTYNSVLFKKRAAQAFGVLNAHYTKANSYKDGGGEKIDFGYKREGLNAVFGYVFNPYNELNATFLYDNIKDDKQPHYIMDAVRTTRYVTRLNYRLGEQDLSNTMNLSLFYRDISRRANNFELRPAQPARTKMEVERNILDLSAKYDGDYQIFESLNLHTQSELIYTKDRHKATRFMKPPTATDFARNGFRIPNAHIDEITLSQAFAAKHDIGTLRLGLEYKHNEANLKDRNTVVATNATTGQVVTPNNIWLAHYGQNVKGRLKKDAFSAALSYELSAFDNQKYTLSLQSIERIGTNDERFVSINPPGNTPQAHAQAWVSNPFLKNERHNRIKFETEFKDENYKDYLSSNLDANAFKIGTYALADFANDFIIYDRFHAAATQNLRSHIISRNVDARIYSLNANLAYNFLGNFGLKFNIWYNYGQNESDKRPLYQIRPLEAQLNLDYEDYAFFGKFNLGSAFRALSKQKRRDISTATGLGIDKKTSGFGVMDIYAGFTLYDKIGLKFGIDNVFDKKYAEFISSSHVEAIAPSRVVSAPGRVYYLSIHGNF